MAPTIILRALSLLLLSYLTSVSSPTKVVSNHTRYVTLRLPVDRRLRTSLKYVPPNVNGFSYAPGDKTSRESLGHKLKASSKFASPNVKSFTNDQSDTISGQSISRRQKISSKVIVPNDQRDAKPRQSSESRLKAASERDFPALRRRSIRPIRPRLDTDSLFKETTRKPPSQDSKTVNQLITHSEYAPPNLHDTGKDTSLRQSGPVTVKAIRRPTNASPRTEIGKAKEGPKNYTSSRNYKGKLHILQDPVHDNFTLTEVEAKDNKLSSQRGEKNSSKTIFVSHMGLHNIQESDSTYPMSRPNTSNLPYTGQIHEGKQTGLHRPKLTGSQNTVADTIQGGSGTINFQSDIAKNVDLIEHNHDTFRCGRSGCKCSYTRKGKITAACSNLYITRFPLDLPTDTWQLILLGSRIKRLNMTHLTTYSLLSKLKLSNNKPLKDIEKSANNMTSPISELDLSENTIDSLEDNIFELMPRLLTLNLAYNRIKAITNLTFSGLEDLRRLNLSHNKVRHIDSAAFDSLKKLQTLDFSKNPDLGYYENVLSPRLMEPLKKLQYLLLHGSSHGCIKYPNKTLQELRHLQRLSINGFNGTIFGPEIRTLKHLTHLDLGFHDGKCDITEITNIFFQNLRYLDTLTLTYCNKLQKIESTIPGKPLCKSLRHLRIAGSTGYDLTTALSDLKAFQNSSLQTLAFVALYRSDSWLPCRFLRRDDALHLKNLQLEELDLSNNRLSLLANDFLTDLPKTLKRLILTNNRFTLDGIGLNRLSSLNELVEIDISYQNMASPFYQMGNINLDSMYTSTSENVCRAQKTAVSVAESKQSSNYSFKDKVSVSKFPPKLQIIRASYYNSFGMRVLYFGRRENALKEVYFSNSFLTKFRHGPLSPSIEIADLSSNYCDSIGTKLFQTNNSLVYLSLQNNFLGEEFANDINGSVFAKLTNTKYLDLRYNVIYNLPRDFFRGLRRLETLKLSKNKLQVLDVRFSHMTSLQMLSLKKNSISWISRETRDDLDILAASHPLQVDLTMNPLPCTCEGLELINWMAKTNVHFMYTADLECRLQDGKTVKFGDLQERSRSLQRHCAPTPLIIVISLASICVMAILVGFSVLYRYRWKLRYWRHIVLARTVGFKPQQNQDQGYKFDAYILYTEDTRRFVHVHFLQELETKRGHRLCISERDFLPGTYDISNIVSAIQNSAKTVVVVTPDLYEDEYSEYGIKMAIMEELYKNRNVLHLCVYQPMTPDDMAKCHDLLMVMKRNHYTEYPPDDQATEEIRQNFWDQLSLAIGHEHDPQAPAELELQ